MTGRVWFLTGSQGLYGEETLQQVAQQSQEIAKELGAALPVELAWKPVLTDSPGIHQTMLAANADPDCIGVIAWMHTFSPARMWIHGLDALQKPLLHLHTQANQALPWSTIDMDFMNLNQAAHGDREFGYIEARLGVVRKIVAGHVSDAVVQRKVASWTRAARGWAEVRSLRLARFGDTMRDVAVTEGDRTEAQWRWGVTVNGYAVTDLADAVHASLDAEVDRLVAEYEERYEVAGELRRGGERHESLRYSARIELGLRALLDKIGAKAFTTNFEDLGALRQLPGLAVQRLMAEGYGFAGEGDWKTATLLRTLKVAADGLPGGTSFMEDYTYHLGPGTRRCWARTCSRCARRSRPPPRAWRSTRSASATARTRSGWCSTPSRARPSSSACPTWATASGSCSTRSTWCRPTSRCPTSPSPGRCGSRGRISPPRRRPGSWPVARTTPCSPRPFPPMRSPTSPSSPAPSSS